MTAILKLKDGNGNVIPIQAIKGEKGDKGDKGDRGLPGSGGVPDGGTTGQVLTKNSDADGDAGWKDSSGGSYTLPVASSTTLGGVKIGSGIAVDETGVISTNGNTVNFPLLYETITTEEVRWIDTDNNAFTAKSMVIVELLSIKTTTNEANKPISCSTYGVGATTQPSAAYSNNVLALDINNGFAKDYDRFISVIAFRGENGFWKSLIHVRTVVNDGQENIVAKMTANTNCGNKDISGIIIGDKSAASGTRVFGVGTTLKIWGV